MGKDPEEKKVDETWKAQAQQEKQGDSPAEQQAGKPAEAPETSADEQQAARPPLPEPSLKTFVSGLAGQVLINLGLFPNPATGKPEKDLEQAKYSIDLLDILKGKMHGNLTDEEQKLIDTMLYDLRMRYVEACR